MINYVIYYIHMYINKHAEVGSFRSICFVRRAHSSHCLFLVAYEYNKSALNHFGCSTRGPIQQPSFCPLYGHVRHQYARTHTHQRAYGKHITIGSIVFSYLIFAIKCAFIIANGKFYLIRYLRRILTILTLDSLFGHFGERCI